MVIYDVQIIFVIKSEHVSTNHLPWSYWDVMMYDFLLMLFLLICKTCGTVFIYFLISLFMLGQYMNSCASSFVFSMPI